MGSRDYFAPDQWNVCCQRCGTKYKSSQLRQEWTNLRVCHGTGTRNCWEPRHPQDFVKGKEDRQSPPWVLACGPEFFMVNAFDDCYEVEPGQSVPTDILSNDDFTELVSITFQSVPDAAVGVFKYTDAGSVERTVVAGAAIAFSDFNSPVFEADAGASAGTIDGIRYQILDTRGNTATANVKVIIAVAEAIGQRYNIVFLLDASDAAMSANGNAYAISANVGDVNGDGKANAIFDASLSVMQDVIDRLVSDGVGSNVKIGVYSFESQIPSGGVLPTPASALTSSGQTVFTPTTNFTAIYADYVTAGTPFGDNGSDLVDNGTSYYETAMKAANDFVTANSSGASDINLVYFLTGTTGADVGNDYLDSGGVGQDGVPDGFVPVAVLEAVPGLGPQFAALGLSDTGLTTEMLAAQALGISVDIVHFGGSIATNSALYAFGNATLDSEGNTLSGETAHSIGSQAALDTFLNTLSGVVV